MAPLPEPRAKRGWSIVTWRKRLDGRIIVSVGMLLMATAATYIKPTIAVGVLLALATFVANLTMSSKEPASIPRELTATAMAVRRELISRARGAVLEASAASKAGRGTNLPPSVKSLLEQMIEYGIRDYVEEWYVDIYRSDPAAAVKIKAILWHAIDAGVKRLSTIDFNKFLVNDFMIIFSAHIQMVDRCETRRFPSHPCLVNKLTEIQYLRKVADVMLRALMPPDITASDPTRTVVSLHVWFMHVLREVLIHTIQKQISENTDSNKMNLLLKDYAREWSLPPDKQAKPYLYAKDYADFMKIITGSKDIDKLEEMRFHIIKEIMTARHIEDMKGGDIKGGAVDQGHLSRRNLSKYAHQLLNSKLECERRIVLLGGQDHRNPISMQSSSSTKSKSPTAMARAMPPGSPLGSRTSPTVGEILVSGSGGHSGDADSRALDRIERPNSSMSNYSGIGAVGNLLRLPGKMAGELISSVKRFSSTGFDDSAAGLDKNDFLSFPEIIADGSCALPYFKEHLKKARAYKNHQFWQQCRTVLQWAEVHDEVPCDQVTQLLAVVHARATDQSRLEVSDEILEEFCKIGALLQDEGSIHKSHLSCLAQAQTDVYWYMHERHYRSFVFGEHYRQYLQAMAENTRGESLIVTRTPLSGSSVHTPLGPGIFAEWVMDEAKKKGGHAVQDDATFFDKRRASLRESIKAKKDSMQEVAPSGSDCKTVPSPVTLVSAAVAASEIRDDGTKPVLFVVSSSQEGIHKKSLPGQKSVATNNNQSNEAVSFSSPPGDDELKKLENELGEMDAYLENTAEWARSMGQWRADVQYVHALEEDSRDPVVSLLITQIKGSRGWVATRRVSEFTSLHAQLKACVDWLPSKVPWRKDARGIFGAFTGKDLEQTVDKIQEDCNFFLEKILQDPILCGSEDIFKFLCPTAETMRIRTVENTASSSSGSGRRGKTKEGETEDEDGEDEDNAALEPIFYLISEIFVLKGYFKWFRRQLIRFVKLTYGGTISSNLRETVDWIFSEEWMTFYLESLRDTLFPEVEEQPPPELTVKQAETLRNDACTLLLASIPEVAKTLLGKENALKGAEKVFLTLQYSHMNKHLFYTLFEKFLEHFLQNEIERRILANDLVEMDVRIPFVNDIMVW